MYALNWTHDRKTGMIMVTVGEDQSHLKMTKQLQGAANFFVRTRENNSWITHYLVNWRADDPQLWNCQSFHEWSMWFLTYFLARHIFYAKNLRAWLLRVHKITWQGEIFFSFLSSQPPFSSVCRTMSSCTCVALSLLRIDQKFILKISQKIVLRIN